ncbi:hypothetical protein E2542_SST27477 [Spatholobus suberectus]|nr:hypothetical protein E2542_SST27477 [Spatholobus suberectus]
MGMVLPSISQITPFLPYSYWFVGEGKQVDVVATWNGRVACLKLGFLDKTILKQRSLVAVQLTPMALFPSLPQLQRLLAFLWDSESARRDYSDPHEPRSGPDHWATFRTGLSSGVAPGT